MSKVTDLIARSIVDAGITHVFIYPGGITIPFINAFYDYRDSVSVIVTRNEQTASCMANAYGRMTGKPGVVICQGPYGISTALFGLNEAALGSAPMVLITDITDFGVFHAHGVPQSTSGEYGSLDARGVLKLCCKFVSAPTAQNDCVQAVQQALKHAVTGRPGPCAVVVRSSNICADADEGFLPRLFPPKAYSVSEKAVASDSAVAKTLELLKASRKPVIIAGNGINVAEAYDELRDLATALSLPVVTTSMGKGVFDEDLPQSFGTIGSFGQPAANRIVSQADFLLIVGSRLKPPDTCYEDPKMIDPDRQKIVHVDIDPANINWTFPAALGIQADAKSMLLQLLAAIRKEGLSRFDRSQWIEKMQKLKHQDHFESTLEMEPSEPIHPKWLAGQISKHSPKDTIVTTDGGNNRFWMLRYYSAKPGCYWSPGGTLSVSFGIPAALTAKLLFPDRPVLSVAGDGGFSMQIHALATAVQYGLGVVFVVMNDSQLGMVREGQWERPIGSEFNDTDYAAIARSFGCEGKRITRPSEFTKALKSAYESNRPYVLDVQISREEKIYEQLFSPFAKKSFTRMSSRNCYYK
ncbi:MAG: thiamine pyrophosphate-binding protein [Desulfomonile tiedjei]|nr:thiamine pyrophosphate-binding protein [Desulfomonile tiedjei]